MWFDGVLFDIFSWIPAHDLYKFSTICKTYNELLYEDAFIKKQCKNMQLCGDKYFFLRDSFSRKAELHAIKRSCIINNPLPYASLDFIAKQGFILASDNGLLCCRDVHNDEYPLFLLNPTTRNYLPIPTPDEAIKSYNKIDIVFASDHDDGEDSYGYSLMAIVKPDDWGAPFRSKIYSPEEKIWRDGGIVDFGPRNMCFEYSVKYNGVFYMISESSISIRKGSPFYWPYIMAYDIKNCSSRFLKIPKGARKRVEYSKLGVFKWGSNLDKSFNSVCLGKLLNNVFTVWVLINNGIETNSPSYYWIRAFKIRIKAMGLSSLGDDVRVTRFTVLNGENLLFVTNEKVYSYNIADWYNIGIAEEICAHQFGDNVDFCPFSSTLRTCGASATKLPLSS